MNKKYIPLYRKYRPQTIEQIVGQEHIKKSLANAIQTNRIAHAYLFTGPRGTGKTSTARIFAKSLNCEKGMSVNPCNECENCRNITNSVPIDVIEIDAASNRSVSDAEEIIQSVAMAAVHSRYKIYIIDEVHMLSTTAFNSLLKTLEEPPENVIFILATTEVHKVLDTIKSRCQRYDFKRITTDDISKHLRYIADTEKINITDDALSYIATNSAGGMRDSIALLDQLSVLNSDNDAIGVDDINKLLGRLSFNSLTELFKNICKSDSQSALKTLNEIYNQGNEPVQILSNLLEYFRNALVIKAIENEPNIGLIQLNSEQINILKSTLNEIEEHQITSLIDKCAHYIKELKLTSNPKLWLDVSVLDMANLTQNTTLEKLQQRLSILEGGTVQIQPKTESIKVKEVKPAVKNRKDSNDILPKTTIDKAEKPQQQTNTTQEVEKFEQTKTVASDKTEKIWTEFLDKISSFPTKIIMNRQVIPVKLTEEEVILTVKAQDWLKKFAPGGEKYKFIEEAAKSIFGENVKIIVREPRSTDNQIKKEQNSGNIVPESKENNEKITKQDLSTDSEEDEESENLEQEIEQTEQLQEDTQAAKTVNADASYHTDNVNIAMDLFDGKIIE